jgi:hypothetical protein
MSETQSSPTQAPIEMDPEQALQFLKLYASNSPFRSADGSELIIKNNPYRRPVRREDLDFLTYSKPLKRQNILYLSALASHRMLLNIYETDLILLPNNDNADAWKEFKLFYSNTNKVLGEIVRPFLERHVFSFLDEEIKIEGKRSVASLQEYLSSFEQDSAQSEDKIVATILSSPEQQKTATFRLIQLIGASFSKELAIGRGVLGTDGNILSRLSRTLIATDAQSLDAARQRTSLQNLARSCGLVELPHSYWQFYLSSSMALTNYFHCVARDHSKFFRYLGALYHYRVSFNAHRQQHSEMLHKIFGPEVDTQYFDDSRRANNHDAGTLFQDLIEPVLDAYGDGVVEDIARGFEEHRVLTEIAEEDFITHILWCSQTEKYKEKARLITHKIETEKLNIDLETFVESSQERSTTHVHNSHRLLVIETGEMDFWSCFGPAIRFNPGDKMLIPRYRLHGSVVLSDECIYHQPIISPELLREFE